MLNRQPSFSADKSDLRPHHPFRTEAIGPPFQQADGAVILLHGRGGTTRHILQLMDYLNGIDNLHIVAPQATDNSWYPESFLAPLEGNAIWLNDALSVVDELVIQLTAAGLSLKNLFIGGFSQGACLALEYYARKPQPLGGLFALAGGLIGPPGTSWNTAVPMFDTPIFLGCAEQDPYIPLERVHETAEHLRTIGCPIELETFPGREHQATENELNAVEAMLNRLG